jgi:hypothetical protein
MDVRRRSRRNLRLFWLAVIGLSMVVGWSATIWADLSTPSYVS